MRDDRPLIMGIVNPPPDSASERGATFDIEHAVIAVEQAVRDGVDIVEISGVMLGSGSEVDLATEVDRVVPTVAEVRRRFPDLAIGVDTWRSVVGRLACQEGADLLNDVGVGADPRLPEVAAEFGTGYVCSHGGESPRSHAVSDRDGVADGVAEATRAARHLVELGVPPSGILIDPSRDFQRNPPRSPELSRRFDEWVNTGWPVLVTPSNADLVAARPDASARDRHVDGLATTAIRAWQGVGIFRAPDVARARRVLDMVAVIRGAKPPVRTVRGLV